MVEQDPVRRLYARLSPYVARDLGEPDDCAGNASLIVGATGYTVLDGSALEKLRDGVYLMRASSDQVEFGVQHLRSRFSSLEVARGVERFALPGGRRLNLLVEGYPMSFYGSESVPNQSIDPIMSLLFLCASELASGGLPAGRCAHIVDDLIATSHRAELFMEIHSP